MNDRLKGARKMSDIFQSTVRLGANGQPLPDKADEVSALIEQDSIGWGEDL